MLPDTGIDDVKRQRNAEYAKHINVPVLSSLKMEGIRLLFMHRIVQEVISVLIVLKWLKKVCVSIDVVGRH
jgi:hypothetical protein